MLPTVGGRADLAAREGPVSPGVNTVAPREGPRRAAAPPALSPVPGRPQVPDGVVRAPVAPVETAANHGVAPAATLPAAPDVVLAEGRVPPVVVSTEVADGTAPPSSRGPSGAVAATPATPGGGTAAEALAVAPLVGVAPTARAGAPGVPYDGVGRVGDVPRRVQEGETPVRGAVLPVLSGSAASASLVARVAVVRTVHS